MNINYVKIRRILAAILVFVLIVQYLPAKVTATDGDLPVGNTLGGWQVNCYWGNGMKTYDLHSSTDEQIDVKLTVEYYAPLSVMQKSFDPGTVSFSIPDIGDVKRSGTAYVPLTAADSADSDWNCTYDITTKSYVFTNKNTFEANKPLSGGFELTWQLETRKCTDGYEMKENPVFTLEGESIKMLPIEFSCHTDRDYYRISFQKYYLEYNDSFNNGIDRNNYITYDYKTYFSIYEKARGGELNTYFVKVTINDDSVTEEQYSNIIYRMDGKNYHLTKIEDPYTGEQVFGFYRFVNYEREMLITDSFLIAYPKELNNKTATVDTCLAVHYLDEEEGKYIDYTKTGELYSNEKLTGKAVAPIKFYDYVYTSGNFSTSKTSIYESYTRLPSNTPQGLDPGYDKRYLSKKIFNNEKVRFTISGNYKMTAGAGAPEITLKKAVGESDGKIDPSEADLSTTFDMVLGDDRLYVQKNDLSMRLVETDEYTVTGLLCPAISSNYQYDIYVSNIGYNQISQTVANNRPGKNDYRLYDSGRTGTVKIVDFADITLRAGFEDYTDGVKAVYLVVHGVNRNFSYNYNVDIAFGFDEYRELSLDESNRIDTEGKIVNVSYMRVFKSDNPAKNMCKSSTSGYIGSDTDKLLDSMAYTDDYDATDYSNNELLCHANSAVYLRDMLTFLSSVTRVDSTLRAKENGGGYNINIESSGLLYSETQGANSESIDELYCFSLYVKIPNQLTIDEQLNQISLVSCSGKDAYGQTVQNSEFEDHVSYRLISLDSGEKVIVADFDFTDAPLDISSLTSVQLKIPAVFTYAAFKEANPKAFNVESYIMLQDKGVQKIFAITNPTTDLYDFNENQLTGETMASSNAGKTYAEPTEWLDTAEKLVKSYTDDAWQRNYDSVSDAVYSETSVSASGSLLDDEANKRAEYSYKVSVDLGSKSSDIIFADVLENEEDSEWKGTLRNIDFSNCFELGLVPDVYYHMEAKAYTETITNEVLATYTNNLEEDAFIPAADAQWNGTIWMAPSDQIKSIVVHLSCESLPEKEISKKQVYFLMNMIAPEYNEQTIPLIGKYAINAHKVYYTIQNEIAKNRTFAQSNIAKVKLLEPTLHFTFRKIDSETKRPLTGAEFSFYSDSDCTIPVIENLSVNKMGELVVENLKPDQERYYYKEVKAPDGYKLDKDIHVLEIRGNSDRSYKEDSSLMIENEPLKGKIVFTKKDADDSSVSGLAGAEYELFNPDGTNVYTDENNEYQKTSGTKFRFVTDEQGQFEVKGLPWGAYYLEEKTAPQGYEINPNKVWVSIKKSAYSNLLSEDTIVVYCEQGDDEQTAGVKLTKFDANDATALENAWFSLEKLTGEDTWQTVTGYEYLKSGKNGVVTAENLKFGTYRFKEINAPVGYVLDSANLYSDSVTLNASTVGTTLKVTKTNERMLGSASLRKYSDNGIPLNGARFNLYMVKGKIDGQAGTPEDDPKDIAIKLNLVTKTINGRVGMIETVTDLEWGEYYFKELLAPSGYVKDSKIYSFEINAENAAMIIDDFAPVNERKKGEVILTKTAGEAVDSGSAHYAMGDPIPDAVFVLCNDSNEQLWVVPDDPSSPTYYSLGDSSDPNATKQMTTNASGEIQIKEIPWGAYYLEETVAPTGFAVAQKIRFSVNSGNCLSVQSLDCEEMAAKCQITIDKSINSKEDVFGTPTFLFKIQKMNAEGHVEEEFLRPITLTGSSMEGSTSLYVKAGKYRISEIEVNRYQLSSIEYVLTDGKTTIPDERRTQDGNVFEFTLNSDGITSEKVEVRFNNTLTNYRGFSHNSAAMNIIPAERKMTGFSLQMKNQIIDCALTEHDHHVITVDDLEGIITYDDGTSQVMTAEELAKVVPLEWTTLNPVTTWSVDNGYLNAENSFIENAKYTDEKGKTFKTNFTVTIGMYQMVESQKVTFINDKDNACVFPNGEKSSVVNTVFYGEDEAGEKTAVVGSYIKPVTVTGLGQLQNWKVIGGDYDGTLIIPTENAVRKFLEDHYDAGLRELKLQAVLNDEVFDFYPGEEEQELQIQRDGIYFIEGWGGKGGNVVINGVTVAEGGKGGYSYAYLYLQDGDTIHVTVGGNGDHASSLNTTAAGGYNGGASASSGDDTYNAAGGGATHFYITTVGNGLLSEYSSAEDQSKVLLVAGGGGGASYYVPDAQANDGGSGGGLIGGPGSGKGYWDDGYGSGGTQSEGGNGYNNTGSFGEGGTSLADHTSGGGGGWYGGGGGYTEGTAAGGGSGYVNDDAVIVGDTIGGNDVSEPPADAHATVTFVDDEIDLPGSGSVHQFIVPVSGYYKLEAWGAAGGSSLKGNAVISSDGSYHEEHISEGGRGGYACGTVYLNKGQIIYYALGKMGENKYINQLSSPVMNEGSVYGGYNGGGDQTPMEDAIWSAGSGGGASYFMLEKQGDGLLGAYAQKRSELLLVAGGGGGSGYYYQSGSKYWYSTGGCGGGETAQSNYGSYAKVSSDLNTAGGGTQFAGGSGVNNGSFGQGGQGGSGTAGGGSGFFGGASGMAAGGGSGYVNSAYLLETRNVNGIYEGSYTTASGSVIEPEYIPTFAGAIVDDGIVGKNSGATQMYGNRGDGFAKITFIPHTEVVDFDYTGKAQSFTASVSGYYKLEAWGAQGGDTTANDYGSTHMLPQSGGTGGYSYGTVYLEKGQTIYLAVGGEGKEVVSVEFSEITAVAGGFNGGGYATSDGNRNHSGSGGGATHFALSMVGTGVLSGYENVKDEVLLVAGGGGGAYSSSAIQYYSQGGYGGGENGGDAVVYYTRSSPLTGQTVDGVSYPYYYGITIPGGGQEAQENTIEIYYGTFGQGADANGNGTIDAGGKGKTVRDLMHTGTDSGAGGGWYGGARLCNKTRGGMAGGGGSGHCNTLALSSEYAYATIGGNETFLSPEGVYEKGHTGNGHARITFVCEYEKEEPEENTNTYEFIYTGKPQTFVAPVDGEYQFEAWGASGGDTITTIGGKGAYTSGKVHLNQGQIIYVYVGGAGTGYKYSETKVHNPGGFNGGGNAISETGTYADNRIFASGGGATDFRLVGGDCTNFDSLKSRIMVAAGGGGAMQYNTLQNSAHGGYGGALKGGTGVTNNGTTYTNTTYGGEQTKGGYCSFKVDNAYTGIGKFGYASDEGTSGSGHTGGGSGYYAGGTSRHTSAGAGGSSFVSGYSGCKAIKESSTENNISHETHANHYSGMVFTEPVMIAGNARMPFYRGTGQMTGNTGNGFAKITLLED
ncbi:MAG: hypothetical protein II919_00625 [Lachnospiraceae bacterium]|nr:hypothetical protein [Lachnospiraceae bacterium]